MCKSRKRPDKKHYHRLARCHMWVRCDAAHNHSIEAVMASHRGCKEGCPVMAMADTVAQVCVAEPALLAKLGLQCIQAYPKKGGLRDVADLPLACLGTVECCFALDGRSTRQEVFMVKTARNLFISLTACKELGLVPDTFPFHVPTAAGTGLEPVSDPGLPPTPKVMPYPPLEKNVERLQE
ncbi:hypothetical protein E2C01_056737 [Portunus trituberculatus]|uniref:Uncharacterized protein n=1 Tax=Portunus trituberculatus TaxID=210409 RepID=A0A5B7H0E9_PORTR|nr:hypothetical protein [Portunus trituberculatus]